MFRSVRMFCMFFFAITFNLDISLSAYCFNVRLDNTDHTLPKAPLPIMDIKSNELSDIAI